MLWLFWVSVGPAGQPVTHVEREAEGIVTEESWEFRDGAVAGKMDRLCGFSGFSAVFGR
jgi:hypothetical protein